MDRIQLEALLKTLDVWLIVFGVLVAIGVTGEAVVGYIHFRKGAELQRLQAEELAKQQERAAIAEYDLAKLRRRTVKRDVFLAALRGQPRAKVEIMYLRDDPDCFDVAQQIWRLLQEAKWEVVAPIPIPPGSPNLQMPIAMSVGGQPSGVTVVAHSVSEKEAEADLNSQEWEHTPWTVLSNALLQSLGQIAGSGGGPNSPPEGTLRVVISPRL